MATLLDDQLEMHFGPEPRVLTEDVQVILNAKIRPGMREGEAPADAAKRSPGETVALIAEHAKVSSRTVYRVLNPDEARETISLDLADRLCRAAESHLKHCRLVWPSGMVTDYVTLPGNLG